MIISNSHNFVFLRVPKVASSSVAQAIYDSDLVSLGRDMSPGLEQEYFQEGNRSHKGRLAINSRAMEEIIKSGKTLPWESWWPWPKGNPMFFAHASYVQLVEMGLIRDGIPSYATIRHPVDRFLSVWSFLFRGMRSMSRSHEAVFANAPPEIATLLNADPNEFFDYFFTLELTRAMKNTPLVFLPMFRKPQTWWSTEDTQYWAVENLARDLAKLFEARGVSPVEVPHIKRDAGKKDRSALTESRQKALTDYFGKDLQRWESLQA